MSACDAFGRCWFCGQPIGTGGCGNSGCPGLAASPDPIQPLTPGDGLHRLRAELERLIVERDALAARLREVDERRQSEIKGDAFAALAAARKETP